jgi:hypothetical protein
MIFDNGQITQKNLQIWKITGKDCGEPHWKAQNQRKQRSRKTNGFVSVKPIETIPEPEPEPEVRETTANAVVAHKPPEQPKRAGKAAPVGLALPTGPQPRKAFASSEGLTREEINQGVTTGLPRQAKPGSLKPHGATGSALTCASAQVPAPATPAAMEAALAPLIERLSDSSSRETLRPRARHRRHWPRCLGEPVRFSYRPAPVVALPRQGASGLVGARPELPLASIQFMNDPKAGTSVGFLQRSKDPRRNGGNRRHT